MKSADALTLYAVLPETGDMPKLAAAAIEGGATCIQLRLKGVSPEAYWRCAAEVLKICRAAGVPLIVNDSVETALACGADGVHLGQSDGSPAAARRLLGPEKWIGVSAATVAEAVQAARDGADYLGAGAVFPTSTKADASAVSPTQLRAICGAVKIPVAAIGGISETNLPWLAGSGIAGVAVVSALFGAADIAAAARRLKAAAETMLRAPFDGGRGMIFDLDGTLLDSMPMWYTIGSEWLRSRGTEPDPNLDRDLIQVSTLPDAAVFLKERCGLPESPEAIEAGLTAFVDDAYRTRVAAKPGAAAYLRRMKAAGWKLALATATERPLAEAALRRLGMLDCFDGIASGGKSTPDTFFRALELLGTRLSETMVYEDAPHALATARAAGFPVTAVFDPFWGAAWEEAANAADAVIREFPQ